MNRYVLFLLLLSAIHTLIPGIAKAQQFGLLAFQYNCNVSYGNFYEVKSGNVIFRAGDQLDPQRYQAMEQIRFSNGMRYDLSIDGRGLPLRLGNFNLSLISGPLVVFSSGFAGTADATKEIVLYGSGWLNGVNAGNGCVLTPAIIRSAVPSPINTPTPAVAVP
jgi:hypothetical protein